MRGLLKNKICYKFILFLCYKFNTFLSYKFNTFLSYKFNTFLSLYVILLGYINVSAFKSSSKIYTNTET